MVRLARTSGRLTLVRGRENDKERSSVLHGPLFVVRHNRLRLPAFLAGAEKVLLARLKVGQ